jgi:hypothetical protein
MNPVTPYFPIQLPYNLRFNDLNGNPVTQLFPVAATAQLDNPMTGAISCGLAAINTLITQMNQVNAQLAIYNNTTIPGLQAQINAINTSGAIAIPQVNAYCLSSPANQSVPLNVATTYLISNTCAYNTVLGTTTSLTNAILAECTNLNTSQAYSQNSVMSGLAGWVSTPTTIAQSFNNLWLAYCDMRTGVTQALAQSNITCASVVLNYQGVYNMNAQTISMYFYSSSIPANFSASGASSGTFTVTDVYGNVYTQSFNLYSVVATGSIILNIGSSALAQNSSYKVVLSYALTSTTPALGCNGSIPNTVVNNTATCPVTVVTAVSGPALQYTFTPTIISNVIYTVSLINSSGTTSGGTVLATNIYNNPVAPTTGTFTGLSISTLYFIRVSVTVNGNTTVCPLISQRTGGS